MAISPQRLTIYLYSAHRAVIFAIAQLSFLPTRRYATAGLCESNVSVCLSRAAIVLKRYCVMIS